jgi:hypothetical protein
MENNEGKKIADSRVGVGKELSVSLNDAGRQAKEAHGYIGTLERTDSYGLTMKTVVNMKPVLVYVKYVYINTILNKDDIDSIQKPDLLGFVSIDDGDSFTLPPNEGVGIRIPPGGLINDIESEH